MVRKYYKIVLPLLTCSLFGCSTPLPDTSQEASNVLSSESSSTTENSTTYYDDYIDPQIKVIVENRDVWKITYVEGPGEPVTSPYSFFYITDFDHNGRLEITAAETQGTGIITSAQVYEINLDCSGIDLIDNNDNAPEFDFRIIKTFYSETDQTYIYIGTNYEKSGVLWGDNIKCAVYLDQGVLHYDKIAEEVYQPKDKDSDELVYSYTDNSDKVITKEQFENAEDEIYKNYTRQDVSLGVIYNQSENEFEKLPDDTMALILQKSYETYSGQISYDEFNEIETTIRSS